METELIQSNPLYAYADQCEYKKEDVVGYECQHAFYAPRHDNESDMLFIKEYIHLKDGRKLINKRKLIDHPRKFWITNPRYRNHKDKLEWVEREQVDEYESPQYAMCDEMARILRYYGPRRDLRTLAECHWIYGADISPTSLIRQRYRNTFPKCRRPASTMATLDLETDVIKGHKKPIISVVTYKDRACLAICREWLDGYSPDEFKNEVRAAFNKHLGTHIEARRLNVELIILDTPGQICAHAIKRLHEWQPDFVNVWNINFDMPKIIDCLSEEGFDLARVFSDPDVPDEYAYFYYHQGKPERPMRSGKILKLTSKEQWHTVDAPATFQWVDGMCYYYYRRKTNGMMSVGLDNCLDRHCNLGKLKFPEVKGEGTLQWHQTMQRHHRYKAIYCAYALFDGIGLEILDEKTKDVAINLVEDIGFSDLRWLNSMPKGLADALHYSVLSRGWVLGTVSNNMETPIDKILPDINGWIIAMPTYNLYAGGIPVIKEMPHLKSLVFIHVFDADVVRTYPTCGQILGVSRETTYKERTIKVKGMTEDQIREWGVNFSCGITNAVELCVTGLGLPPLSYWEE